MAARAASPRRTLTAEEKVARDKLYRVKPQEFTAVLKEFVQVFNALVLLNSALGQAGKGAYLVWPHPQRDGELLMFSRKHLRSANAKFARGLLLMKNYLRVSKKRVREHIPADSLSGVYTPVYAGEALTTFFSLAPQNFGLKNGGTEPLISATSLTMAQQGYLLRNTTTMLFYIYAHAMDLQEGNNAQYARSDAVMDQAFGGDIPAAFYVYPEPSNKTKKNKSGKVSPVLLKVTMDQAVAMGLIPRSLNTYDMIKVAHPDFTPDRFKTYSYQNIAAANYFSKAALSADPNLAIPAGALGTKEVRAAMLEEHNIVKEVSAEWRNLLEPDRKPKRDARKKEADAKKRAAAAVAGR